MIDQERERVKGLIEKWRASADSLEKHPAFRHSVVDQRDVLRLRQCALYLEAVISSPPTMQSQIAERISRKAHAGQKEESTGDDYIRHIERVVALVDGDDAKAVAWLHDVLEDTQVTSTDLTRAGISDSVLEAVMSLTRTDEPYSDYIRYIKICGPELARVVKIADLRDHLRPNCPESLRPRYEAALKALTGVSVPASDQGEPVTPAQGEPK